MKRSLLHVGAFVLVVGAAHAQGDARARAEVPFKEGVALHDKGKDAEALKKFEEAYAIFQSPNILFNVARMEQVLGNGVGALKHYRACLKDTTLTEANRKAAEEHTRNLEKNVGRISVDAPAGSKVRVDSDLAQDVGEPIIVVPGHHRLEVVQGERKESRELDVGSGELAVVKITFATPENASAPTTPKVTPPAQGNTNTTSAQVTNPGDYSTEQPKPSAWTTPRIITVATLGVVGVSGIVLGFVFKGGASDALDESKSIVARNGGSCTGNTPDCNRVRDLKDTYDSKTTLSTVSFITGGAFAAGAVLFTVWWPKGDAKSATIVPTVAPNGAGVQGTF